MKYLQEEFRKGLNMAADPANANLPDLAIRTTTIYSAWYAQTCSVCHFKFREGDQVRLCPKCNRPFHNDSQFGLFCWEKHFTPGTICTQGGVDRFSEAKRETPSCDFVWRGAMTEKKESAETIDAAGLSHASTDATLVTQFTSGLERIWKPFGEQNAVKVQAGSPAVGRNCPWCRFKIRAGDWVVECPCGCGTYFHQDIFRHLTCWNEWNGVEGNDYCPITGRSYVKEELNDEQN